MARTPKRRRPRAKSEASKGEPVRQAVAISRGEVARRFEYEVMIRFDRPAGDDEGEDGTQEKLVALIRGDVIGLVSEEHIESIEIVVRRVTVRPVPPTDEEL